MAAPKKKPAKAAASAKKKAAAKPAKKPASKAGTKADKRKRKGPARGKAKKPGKRLTAAQKSLRDTRMLTLQIQGLSLEEIGAEVGLSVGRVKERILAKKKELPRLLDMDAAAIIENFVVELQVSISDFEKIASAAVEGANLPVAVGAKGRANDARTQLRELLQSVGALPHDLGTLTWVIDIRAVVTEINTTVENFAAAVGAMDLPKDKRDAVLDAAGNVVAVLDEIAESPQTVTPTATNGGGPDG